MKKLSLLLMLIGVSGLIFMVQPATAQWTQNGDQLYNSNQNSQIGIGTTNPISRLHVEGNYGANLFKVRNYLGQTQLTVSNNGFLGLGTWDPEVALDVYQGHIGLDNDFYLTFRDTAGDYKASIALTSTDTLRVQNHAGNILMGAGAWIGFAIQTGLTDCTVNVASLQDNGAVYSNEGTLTNSDPSSRDYKKNIKPLDLDAERVLKLEPKSYTWKKSGKEDFGYIAEEVQEVIPEIYSEQGNTKGYNSHKLRFYIIEMLKKQEDRIVGLESEIKTLKARLDTDK